MFNLILVILHSNNEENHIKITKNSKTKYFPTRTLYLRIYKMKKESTL